mmetsp:Transcript_58142/g.188177  ORF Transcript_58142/g.188177 Transcript_58142/m.188177 type:complete len:265 (+) Transcript_58142:423-1217(+)
MAAWNCCASRGLRTAPCCSPTPSRVGCGCTRRGRMVSWCTSSSTATARPAGRPRGRRREAPVGWYPGTAWRGARLRRSSTSALPRLRRPRAPASRSLSCWPAPLLRRRRLRRRPRRRSRRRSASSRRGRARSRWHGAGPRTPGGSLRSLTRRGAGKWAPRAVSQRARSGFGKWHLAQDLRRWNCSGYGIAQSAQQLGLPTATGSSSVASTARQSSSMLPWARRCMGLGRLGITAAQRRLGPKGWSPRSSSRAADEWWLPCGAKT